MLFRKFEPGDQDDLIDLLNLAYNGWHSPEYFKWKFGKNPHGNPLIWVAEDNDRIVGCYIINPVRIRMGKVSVLCAQSVDAAVDPEYRGKGIFKKLAQEVLEKAHREGIVAVYAFPTHIAYKGQVRVGYQTVFTLPKTFKLLDPSRMLEKYGLTSKKLQRIVKHFLKLQTKTSKEEPTDGKLEIERIKAFDEDFEDFWETFYEKNDYVMIERGREYLNWRYFGNPEKEYLVYMCKQNKKILGYLISSVERSDLFIGNIIDVVTLPNMPEVATCLVHRCLKRFENEGLDLASCWMLKHNSYYTILKNQGFSEHLELARRLVFRPKHIDKMILYVTDSTKLADALNTSVPDSSGTLKWFITMGDTDFM